MYCRNCGCKISTGEKRCSDCGTDINEIEYCGGFWGLVGEDESIKKLAWTEEKTNEISTKKINREKTKSEKEYERLNDELNYVIKKHTNVTKKYKNLKKLFVCAILMLLSICLLQLIWISYVSKKYETLYMKYDELNLKLDTHYNELINQFENLSISETEESKDGDFNGHDETEEILENKEPLEKPEKIADEVDEVVYETEEILDETEDTFDNEASVSDNVGRRFKHLEGDGFDNE